jgi:lysophospholipase L1-like esterase
VPLYQKAGKAHINSLGFRGPEFDKEKNTDTYRIVALGSSTTYGIYNAFDETYPYQLEQQLKSIASGPVEVINAGLVSATTMESLIRFYSKVLELKPDMILIYEGFNDLVPRVFDNFRTDYYHFRQTPSDPGSVFSELYLTGILTAIFAAASGSQLRNDNLINYTWRENNLPNDIHRRAKNFQSNGPDVFERNLEQLLLVAKANNIAVVLSNFAYTSTLPNWTDAVPADLWNVGIHQNNAIIEKLAVKYKLPLCRFFELAEADPSVFLKDSIHLSRHGNAKLAECFRLLIQQQIRDWQHQVSTTESSRPH